MSPVRSTNNPLDLLRQLGAGVRPDGVGASKAASAQGLESASFDDLLALAREGNVEPGAPLSIARDVTSDLSAEALAALSIATDAAEAKGATRLAAQIDGRVATIDVLRREIVGIEPAQANAVIAGVDAFVALAPSAQGGQSGSGGGRGAGAPLALPGSLPENETLARTLLGLSEKRAG
jgi:hypothetical protein